MTQIPKIIAAQSFHLVDGAGNLKGSLSVDPNGNPYLSMRRTKHGDSINLGIGEDERAYLAVDSAKKAGLKLEINEEGNPQIIFFAPGGKAVSWIGVGEKAQPEMVFFDNKKKLRLTVDVGKSGAPAVRLYGGGEKSYLEISVEANGSPRVTLHNKDGEEIKLGWLPEEPPPPSTSPKNPRWSS